MARELINELCVCVGRHSRSLTVFDKTERRELRADNNSREPTRAKEEREKSVRASNYQRSRRDEIIILIRARHGSSRKYVPVSINLSGGGLFGKYIYAQYTYSFNFLLIALERERRVFRTHSTPHNTVGQRHNAYNIYIHSQSGAH